MEYTWINIFGALVEYFAIYAFLWIFFGYDNTKKRWLYVCNILMPVLFFLFATYVSNIYLRPALFVMCTWLIAYGFQGGLTHRIFTVSVFQIILILMEIGLSFFLQPSKDISFETYYLANNIFMKLSTLVIVAVLFLISRKRKRVLGRLPWNYVLLLLLFSAMSLILVTFTEYLLVKLDQPSLFPIGCLAIILCVCANVSLYYIFYQLAVGEDAKTKLQLMEVHLSGQKEQHQYVEHTYREIKKLSHDMNHYLSVILNLLQEGKTNHAIEELQKRKIAIMENPLFDTGNSVLNSIMAYKFQSAQEQQIQIQLFWNLPKQLNVSATDLAVILSNGLDNAVEAAGKVTEVQPFISVKADMTHEFIKICISNNTAMDPVVENGKLITTKGSSVDHGWGFESIQTLARRYEGEAFFDYNNHIFVLTVIMKNIESKNNREKEK